MYQWREELLIPIPYEPRQVTAVPHRPRHAKTGPVRRFMRAACRGAARVIAFPLYPEYIIYKQMEPMWQPR